MPRLSSSAVVESGTRVSSKSKTTATTATWTLGRGQLHGAPECGFACCVPCAHATLLLPRAAALARSAPPDPWALLTPSETLPRLTQRNIVESRRVRNSLANATSNSASPFSVCGGGLLLLLGGSPWSDTVLYNPAAREGGVWRAQPPEAFVFSRTFVGSWWDRERSLGLACYSRWVR